MPHGKGKMNFSDGSLYNGYFHSGVPTGEGRLINTHGIYYEGEVQNGQAEGQGVITNEHKAYTYDGGWRGDLPEGQGK